jgi:hypothetical protein
MSRAQRARLTRRAALAGLGTAGAAAFLRPYRSEAQAATSPQRLLLIHRPCGTVPAKWWPTGGATDWVSSSILSSFDKLRNDMVILKGVDCPRVQNWLGDKAGAGMIAMMCPPPVDKGPSDLHVWPVLPGYTLAEQNDTNGRFFTAPDKSIDQLFLEKIPTLGAGRIPSMQLAASQGSANAQSDPCVRVVSYAKLPTAQLPTALWPEYRPTQALANLMAAVMGPQGSLADLALEKSMLDFVTADLTRIRPRLPMSQLPRIDAHISALRDLEKNLTTGGGAQCTPPTLGPLPSVPLGAIAEDVQHLELCKQQMQIIKTAFQCDITRVISFSYTWGESGIHFNTVLPGTVTNTSGYFDISHLGGTNPLQAMESIEKFYADMTAGLLLDMKNTPDGAGSLLDNTLVVYWNHFSDGNASGITDVPVLLFGGKFLNLQGGKFLDFGANGRTMADLWTTTAERWGYNALTAYGAPMWNRGPMTGLYG